jgi:hypothetical protein
MGAVLAPERRAPASGSDPGFSPPQAPRAVLLGTSRYVTGILAPALREHGFEVVQVPCGSRLERPAVVVVEADCAVELLRAVPEPGTPGPRPLVVAVTRWWNENETELRRVADAVLHAPLRRAEFAPVLTQLKAVLHDAVPSTTHRSLAAGTR